MTVSQSKCKSVNQKGSLCTSVAVLASPSRDVAYLFSPKVSQSTQMSVSQPKMVVVYLCGGSGKPSRDVAFLFSPKNQNVSKSTNERSGGGSYSRKALYTSRGRWPIIHVDRLCLARTYQVDLTSCHAF